MKKIGYVGVVIISGCMSFSETNKNNQKNHSSTSPSYSIETVEDISHGGVIVLNPNVKTEMPVGELSDDELLLIAKRVVNSLTNDRDVNGIVVSFYGKGADTTQAKVIWSPQGILSKAASINPGNYSKHEYRLERF